MFTIYKAGPLLFAYCNDCGLVYRIYRDGARLVSHIPEWAVVVDSSLCGDDYDSFVCECALEGGMQ
jgi:hypothetical protein